MVRLANILTLGSSGVLKQFGLRLLCSVHALFTACLSTHLPQTLKLCLLK